MSYRQDLPRNLFLSLLNYNSIRSSFYRAQLLVRGRCLLPSTHHQILILNLLPELCVLPDIPLLFKQQLLTFIFIIILRRRENLISIHKKPFHRLAASDVGWLRNILTFLGLPQKVWFMHLVRIIHVFVKLVLNKLEVKEFLRRSPIHLDYVGLIHVLSLSVRGLWRVLLFFLAIFFSSRRINLT